MQEFEIFKNWCKKKIQIQTYKPGPKYIKERQIWLCYFGKNIDGEQDGDLENFIRPIVVLKSWGTKVKHITVLPLTTNDKKDFSFLLSTKDYPFLEKNSFIILDKVKTLSRKRFIGKKSIGYVSKEDFEKIKISCKNLLFN